LLKNAMTGPSGTRFQHGAGQQAAGHDRRANRLYAAVFRRVLGQAGLFTGGY
jgi:hypothetical protein